MSIGLSEGFYGPLHHDPAPDRASVIVLGNVGNWKALYPIIRATFPKFPLEAGVHYPVVFGGDEHYYLKRAGALGAAEFKAHVRRLLRRYDRIFVFDAQKIQCLRSNPACASDMLIPGKTATLYYRDEPDAAFITYLKSQTDRVFFEEQRVSDDSMSVIATRLSATVIAEALESVASVASEDEHDDLARMRGELCDGLASEVEDHFLAGNFGVPKMRLFARRKIASALLRGTSQPYSTKSGDDPVEFFREQLAKKFQRHALPSSWIEEVSPNLSFVVKSRGRFKEISGLLCDPQ